MQICIGPVLTREGGYAFDWWTQEEGLHRGYTYRRVEDAHYARKFDIRCRENDRFDDTVACNTVDEFVGAMLAVEGFGRVLNDASWRSEQTEPVD